MNYFIKRDLNEYGPYTLADLQKYVASGNILLTDLCRSEGLTDWVPVSQVIGNIPVPAASQPAAAPVAGMYGTPAVSPYPPPPSLHWGVLILLGVVTCGLFGWVWACIQAAWVKKVQPESKGLLLYSLAVGSFVLMFATGAFEGFQGETNTSANAALFLLFRLGGAILWIVASFNLRNSIEEHFNSAEPIGLSLNGVMTFFFSIYYFQYHFTQINEMKRRQMTGYAV